MAKPRWHCGASGFGWAHCGRGRTVRVSWPVKRPGLFEQRRRTAIGGFPCDVTAQVFWVPCWPNGKVAVDSSISTERKLWSCHVVRANFMVGFGDAGRGVGRYILARVSLVRCSSWAMVWLSIWLPAVLFRLGRLLDCVWKRSALCMRSDRTALVRSVWLHNVYDGIGDGFARTVSFHTRSLNLRERSRFRTEGLNCRLSSWIRRLRVRLDGKKGECAGNALSLLIGGKSNAWWNF